MGRDLTIPFIQIRAVSNYVGERDKSKWKTQEAIYNLNETLLEFLDALYKTA
jgi:futalosine hydrolase